MFFNNPSIISWITYDSLRIEYPKASEFLVTKETSTAAPDNTFVQVKQIPKLLEKNIVEVLDTGADGSSLYIQAVTVANLFFMFGT